MLGTQQELEEQEEDKPLLDQSSYHHNHSGSKATMNAKKAAVNCVKIVVILGLLYLFICSLDLMSTSFRLLTGKGTSKCVCLLADYALPYGPEKDRCCDSSSHGLNSLRHRLPETVIGYSPS